MILLDTHIWIWWVNNDLLLKSKYRSFLEYSHERTAINIISCWEIAKAVETGKLQLKIPVAQWLQIAIESSSVTVIPLDNSIILDSTSLPGNFHKDPADQLIVATARTQGLLLLTADEKILKYPFVKILKLP